MKKIFYLIVAISFIQITLFGQNIPKPPKTYNIQSEYFTTDKMENIYVVNGNTLKKYDKEGAELYSYSEKLFGDITSVDASNPLRILLFFADQSQIVFLDNTLSKNADAVSLEDISHEQTKLVCSSLNNGFWIYDNNTFSTIRFDQQLHNMAESPNILQLVPDSLEPTSIQEDGDRLYLYNPHKGFYIFDVFGSFSKIIPITNSTSSYVLGDVIYYIQEGKMYLFNRKTFQANLFNIPVEKDSKISIQGMKLYVSYKDSIKIYE